MPDLVAEVAEERPVRFVHRQTAFLALGIVGLGQAEGDTAFVVAGEHLPSPGCGASARNSKRNPLRFSAFRERQLQTPETIERPLPANSRETIFRFPPRQDGDTDVNGQGRRGRIPRQGPIENFLAIVFDKR